jgi:hypothetical protein
MSVLFVVRAEQKYIIYPIEQFFLTILLVRFVSV